MTSSVSCKRHSSRIRHSFCVDENYIVLHFVFPQASSTFENVTLKNYLKSYCTIKHMLKKDEFGLVVYMAIYYRHDQSLTSFVPITYYLIRCEI